MANMNPVLSTILTKISRCNIIPSRGYREKPWKKNFLYRFGYKNPYLKQPDTLPRIAVDSKHAKVGFLWEKPYILEREWKDKNKYFGQNDYIDILGDGSLHPVKLFTNMPAWLRGFRGNEFQMLLQRQMFNAHYRWTRPSKWEKINKRIMYLYRYLNRKTKS